MCCRQLNMAIFSVYIHKANIHFVGVLLLGHATVCPAFHMLALSSSQDFLFTGQTHGKVQEL